MESWEKETGGSCHVRGPGLHGIRRMSKEKGFRSMPLKPSKSQAGASSSAWLLMFYGVAFAIRYKCLATLAALHLGASYCISYEPETCLWVEPKSCLMTYTGMFSEFRHLLREES